MRYMRYLCLLIVMTPLALMAADPVGRITSSGPLTLDGKAVPVTALSSLPLVAGDEVATSSSTAIIFFADKSRATIAPNSQVKLEPNGSSVALRVLSGSVDLNRSKSSQVTVITPAVGAAPKATATASASPAVASASANPTTASNCKKNCPPPPCKWNCPPPPPPPPPSKKCPWSDWDCK